MLSRRNDAGLLSRIVKQTVRSRGEQREIEDSEQVRMIVIAELGIQGR